MQVGQGCWVCMPCIGQLPPLPPPPPTLAPRERHACTPPRHAPARRVLDAHGNNVEQRGRAGVGPAPHRGAGRGHLHHHARGVWAHHHDARGGWGTGCVLSPEQAGNVTGTGGLMPGRDLPCAALLLPDAPLTRQCGGLGRKPSRRAWDSAGGPTPWPLASPFPGRWRCAPVPSTTRGPRCTASRQTQSRHRASPHWYAWQPGKCCRGWTRESLRCPGARGFLGLGVGSVPRWEWG